MNEAPRAPAVLHRYEARLMMVEIRNDAGRKVAVEPIVVQLQAATPQHAAQHIAQALGAAMAMGVDRILQSQASARSLADAADRPTEPPGDAP